MVADSASGTAFVFGGENSSGLVNVTSAYSEANNTWWNVSTVNAPGPRSDFGFALDPTSGVAVLFGGQTNETSLAVSNATWILNVTTDHWVAAPPGVAPPAREAAAFAIDPALGVGLLFGGWNQAYSPNGSITYSDLWELNLSTYAWSRVSVTGARPSPLEGATLTWDPSTLKFEMFGGCFPCSSAVWQFDPVSLEWTELVPIGGAPSARTGASWAYDPTLGVDLLFGGTNGATTFADTYVFSPRNLTWVAQTLSPAPPARSEAASGFLDVPGNETWLVAGGQGMSASYADLWRLSATTNLSLEVVNASSPLSPLAHAEVNLSGRFQGFTNFSGGLNLTQVNAVGHALNVSGFGYYPWNRTLWFPPGQPINLTVALTPEPPGTVLVEVVRSLGYPVPDAELNLTVDGIRINPIPLLTAANGTATFFGVVPGSVNVTTWLPGLRPDYLDGVLLPGGELKGTILVVPDPLVTVVVYGRSSNGDLTPLSGAIVLLDNVPFGVTGSLGEVNGTTTEYGYSSFTGEAPGYAPNITTYPLPWTGPVRVVLILPALPYGHLYVSVFRLGDDLPISGALVNASSVHPLPSGPYTALNTTGRSGLASVALPEGLYLVRATATDYFPSAGVLVAVNASSVGSLDIYLVPVPPANVTFIVHDATTGDPIDGATVLGLGGLAGTTNASGYDNVTDVPPGAYVVTVSAAGYLSNTSVLDLASAETRTDRVNLTPAPGTAPPAWSFSLVPGGIVDLWAFLLVPPLLIVGGFVWVSAARAAGREKGMDPAPAFRKRGPGEPGTRPSPSGEAPAPASSR